MFAGRCPTSNAAYGAGAWWMSDASHTRKNDRLAPAARRGFQTLGLAMLTPQHRGEAFCKSASAPALKNDILSHSQLTPPRFEAAARRATSWDALADFAAPRSQVPDAASDTHRAPVSCDESRRWRMRERQKPAEPAEKIQAAVSCDESRRWRVREQQKSAENDPMELQDEWSKELYKLFHETPALDTGRKQDTQSLKRTLGRRPPVNIYKSLKAPVAALKTPVASRVHGKVNLTLTSSIRSTRKLIEEKAPKRHHNETPTTIDWNDADPSKWKFVPIEFDGEYTLSAAHAPPVVHVKGPLMKGLKNLRNDPTSYLGLFYDSDITSLPPNKQRYSLVERSGGEFDVAELPNGGYTFMAARYQVLKPRVKVQRDAFTDSMSFEEQRLGKPLCPGRGQGCADVPTISVIGDVDPFDVMQGGRVGDCWLLCAMSALAEFCGAVENLFRATPGIEDMPLDGSNSYTITLYDMSSWKPVDIVVDERLCTDPETGALLGCSPGRTGDLWACYLEKAVAIHCGGWDNIVGGQCTHAWRLLTGCRDQYTFTQTKEGRFICGGTFNPNTCKWEKLSNSPHDGFEGTWPMEWPSVGGGGKRRMTVDTNDMFERMCAWDDANYIMACASKEGSDKHTTDGINDGHTYTVLSCVNNVAGTEFDLIKLRNPWGNGEFTAGKWDDDGRYWSKYPQVKEELKPSLDVDDGVFWMDKDEFFKYFKTIFLCALDMAEFVTP